MACSDVIYLDNAATTQMTPEVYAAMKPYFCSEYFNPSSLYAPAQHEKMVLERARTYLASTINARSSEIRFTSGGSEADNAALKGIALANQDSGNHIIVSSVEHHAVLESARWLERRGFEVTYLPVDASGVVDSESLRQAIRPDTILVSIMVTNNEVGSVQPISVLSAIAHEHGVPFHTDAVQAYGHIPLDVSQLGVDALSVSAHKFHGPKGVGFLYCKRGLKTEPLISGGAQERGYRAGTENLAAIVGMEKAAHLAFGECRTALNEEDTSDICHEAKRVWGLREQMRLYIEEFIDDVAVNGSQEKCLPGILSVSFKNVSGEALLALLDQKGICASAGSACASGSLEPSHVLTAMGVRPEWLRGTVRFSFSSRTTSEEIQKACVVLREAVRHLRAVSADNLFS